MTTVEPWRTVATATVHTDKNRDGFPGTERKTLKLLTRGCVAAAREPWRSPRFATVQADR